MCPTLRSPLGDGDLIEEEAREAGRSNRQGASLFTRLLKMGSSSDLVAHAANVAVALGSAGLYAPQLWRVWRRRSARGLALGTFALKLCGYSVAAAYGVTAGLPLSVYATEVVLAAQAAVLVAVVARMENKASPMKIAMGGLAYGGLALALLEGAVAPRFVAALQVCNVGVFAAALLPQLAMNVRNRSSGEYSALTAGLAVGGSAVRLWSTSVVAPGNRLLLAGFVCSVVLNGTLLAQIAWYARQRPRLVAGGDVEELQRAE